MNKGRINGFSFFKFFFSVKASFWFDSSVLSISLALLCLFFSSILSTYSLHFLFHTKYHLMPATESKTRSMLINLCIQREQFCLSFYHLNMQHSFHSAATKTETASDKSYTISGIFLSNMCCHSCLVQTIYASNHFFSTQIQRFPFFFIFKPPIFVFSRFVCVCVCDMKLTRDICMT